MLFRTHFGRFTPTFTQIFPVFNALGYFTSPDFALIILQATRSTLVMGLSLRGGDFRKQLPQKIGSLAKTYQAVLAPSLKYEKSESVILYIFSFYHDRRTDLFRGGRGCGVG